MSRGRKGGANSNALDNLMFEISQTSTKIIEGRKELIKEADKPKEPESSTKAPEGNKSGEKICFKCGKEGHISRKCTYDGPPVKAEELKQETAKQRYKR